MNSIDITTLYSDSASEENIRNLISEQNNNIIIDYPMSHINSTQSHLDIMQNYLEGSYIAEELGRYATKTRNEEIARPPYSPICRLNFEVEDVYAFSRRLYELSIGLSDEREAEDDYINLMGELEDYEASLESRAFLCPDLIDGYYANLVNGGYFEIESESEDNYLKKEYAKHPERRFAFWRSAYSNNIGQTFYVSSDCWIVPRNVDIQTLLERYSGLSSIDAHEEAIFFSVDRYSYLINSHNLVYFPFGPFLNAKKCVEHLTSDDGFSSETPQTDILTYSASDEYWKERYGLDIHFPASQPKYKLSISGSSLIVDEGDFHYIFFPDQVRADKAAGVYDQMSKVFSGLSNFAGIVKSVSLPWDTLDDEQFENLCYDMIYHHPKFDNETIRKMGKSRSRDGGRDIVVYTRDRPGHPKKMYIFQCKYTKTGTSLTTQKLVNISDAIVQYGAKGYGIMTNVIIDSTLYDRVDAICQKFSIESDHWSVLEVERFIARHPKLRERHFKTS